MIAPACFITIPSYTALKRFVRFCLCDSKKVILTAHFLGLVITLTPPNKKASLVLTSRTCRFGQVLFLFPGDMLY